VRYEKLKLTSTLKSIGVGSPSRTVGSYLLLETALNAAGISKGWPLITRIPFTFPCSSIIASITTIPASFDCLARSGYSGSGPNSKRGAFTSPPTRTGALGPVATGAAGGGAPFGMPPRTPPMTPPAWPPGTPPGTPPAIPNAASSGGAPMGSGGATAFGINEGAISFPGVNTFGGVTRGGRGVAGAIGAGGGPAGIAGGARNVRFNFLESSPVVK